MQTPKGRKGSLDVPKKTSPRPARQLKVTGLEPESSSSPNPATRTPKDKNPKVLERRSPRSPVSEKKRPSRISELESQVSQLQEELKKTKDQLTSFEASKKEAEQDAEDSKRQFLEVSSKLEDSKKQLSEHPVSDQDSEVEAAEYQSSLFKTVALASALQEIKQLKLLVETAASSEAGRLKRAELTNMEFQLFRGNLVETLSLVKNFKDQIKDCEVSEVETEALASETLRQLENAKRTVESLRSDGAISIEGIKKTALELEQSKSRLALLEELVNKLQDRSDVGDHENLTTALENLNHGEYKELETEVFGLRCEVERLRSALEAAEKKSVDENADSSSRLQREDELDFELKKARSDIEELKANLMDKETELQCISEENETLLKKLNENQKENHAETELKKLTRMVEELKANLMDKETEFQNISEENETLRSEMVKRETDGQDWMVKLGLAMEEADKSNKKASRVSEQLEAAQVSNMEMESEMRKLKVQSDQWRKAAEAAASMLSAGNNGKVTENHSPVGGRTASPYAAEDMDEDLLKKKNGNVLKKFGVLLKKPHK